MSEAIISNPTDAYNFIYGGRTTFTMVSKRTGTRFTFKTSTNPENKNSPIFVKVLTGSDNETSYTYIGFIRRAAVGLVAGKKGSPEAPSYRGLDWAIHKLAQNEMPADLEIWHSGRCGRCNRKLTVPESIASGLGPVCAGRA